MDLLELRVGNAAGMVKITQDIEPLLAVPTITDIEVGSITVEQRDGNPEPTFWTSHDGTYSLNARGLPGPGSEYYKHHGQQIADMVHDADKCLRVNIASTQRHGDWVELAQIAKNYLDADVLVLNISCPNKWYDGKRQDVIAMNPDAVRAIFESLTRCIHLIPNEVAVKLPPYDDNPHLLEGIISVVREYSNLITEVVSCNTLGGQSTVINGEQVLSVHEAGLSGPSLFKTSLNQAYRIHNQLPLTMKLTVVGGINSGDRVRAAMGIGATGIQVGTHFFNHGPRVFEQIMSEAAE